MPSYSSAHMLIIEITLTYVFLGLFVHNIEAFCLLFCVGGVEVLHYNMGHQ